MSFNKLGAEGAKLLAAALGSNSSLKRLEYATTQMRSPFDDHCHQVSAAADTNNSDLPSHRLANNQLGGYFERGKLVSDLSGVTALAEALKQNGTLAVLKCASPPLMTAFIIVSSP